MFRKILLLMLCLCLRSNVLAFTITGTITSGGTGLSGVTVSASGGTQGTTTSSSNANGAFTANHTTANPVTVTPALAGYTFSPVNKTYNLSANKTGCNFTATQLTYTITGNVGTLVGVTMNGLPGNPVTTSGGAYSATVVYGWNGTVTPAMAGYTFNPVNKTYTNVTANQTAQNYTPTQLTYTLSGNVGTLEGVTMNGLPGTPVTTTGGAYSATVVYGWNGTVTPSYGSYGFNPSQKIYSNVTANQTSQNYGIVEDIHLLGCWNFDNSNANDSSGYEHNGTLSGNASIIDDAERGKVLALDGAGDFVDLGNGSWTNPSNNLTITAWFKVDAFTDAYQTIISKGLYTYRVGRTTNDNKLQFYCDYDTNHNWQVVTGTSSVNVGWHHVAATYNGTYMKMYIDGIQQGGNVSLSTLQTDSKNLCIGRNVDATARDWQGWIDDVRLYNKVLSDAEIAVLAEAQYTISGTAGTVSGITLGGFPTETITATGGAYSSTVLYGWSGTITPEMDGYSFSPANKTYSNVTADQTNQNYTASLITYTISGHTGTLDGVTMNGLPGNPVTSGGGAYSATVTAVWTGTVTPAKTGYTFTPVSRMYSNVGENLTEDYTPVINTYVIYGYTGTIGGVTMNGLPNNPLTATGGAYSGTVTYGWSGTVTPSRTNFTFTPTNKTYSNVTADQSNQNFTAATTIPDESLVGWWPFNGDALDYSGYGNNGTVTGASYVNSDIGTVLDFEGVDYVSIPSSVFTTINDQITISLWQNGDAALQPQNNAIFEGKNGTYRALSCNLPWGDGVVYYDAGYAGATYDRISKTAVTNEYEGQWNHWVFTKDLTTDQMKIYLNGALWTSGSAKSKSMSGITQFKIGSVTDGTSNYDGMICEFRIYNKALTAEQISALYNASYEAITPNPADGAIDVATSSDLSWTAGYLAGEHDVYFGTNAALVTARDASVFKGTQAGTTYDPCTLQNGMTYYWAVDEVNDFYANSPWMGDVWSFTTIGSETVCPICGQAGACNLQVVNNNTRLGRITGVQKVNIIRVTMDGRSSHDMAGIKSNVNKLIDFCDRNSYGRMQLQIGVATSYHAPVGTLSETRSRVTSFGRSLQDALVTVVSWPVGLSGYSNAGGGFAYVTGMLYRDYGHECGHVFGLAHSNRNMDGVFKGSADGSSFMGMLPSWTYTLNQQHWLGWCKDSEVIRINDCLSKVPYIDVPIRPLGDGGQISDIPLSYVYDMPDGVNRLFISVPKPMDDNVNGIGGGEIFIHRGLVCVGCQGMAQNSTLVGRIFNPTTAGPYEVDGLIIDPIDAQYTIAQFDGHNVNKYSQLTLRISLSEEPPVDPNDPNNEPDPVLASWDFNEPAGTVLRNTINSGTSAPVTWNTNRTGITTTGNDTLNIAPTINNINNSVTYFDMRGANCAFGSGQVWTVMEISDFHFAGTVGERLRFGMTNTMENNQLTAEFQLRRAANNSIYLLKYASTGTASGVQIINSNTFSGILEIATAFDFDARTYQIFYRIGGTGSWTAIADPAAMNAGKNGCALRLCTGDDATNGTGSWRDAGEYFHIEGIYMTTADPTAEPANVPPTVSLTYPYNGSTVSAGNITLYALADDGNNPTTLDFYHDGQLLGAGTILADQPTITATAAQATVHGATAHYDSPQNAIVSWTDMADWVSWTKTVTRPSTFEVWVNYSCNSSSANATYRVEVGDQHVHGKVTSTGSTWNTYDSVLLGTVEIAQAGSIEVNVIPESKPNAAVMNLRDVTLIPKNTDDSFQYVWTNVQPGTYTLTAIATDNEDETTESEPVVITVQ